tara:strand:- start:1346 stop:2476 length:1131 start_codon:yes stop_codon:yes gene_type:complete
MKKLLIFFFVLFIFGESKSDEPSNLLVYFKFNYQKNNQIQETLKLNYQKISPIEYQDDYGEYKSDQQKFGETEYYKIFSSSKKFDKIANFDEGKIKLDYRLKDHKKCKTNDNQIKIYALRKPILTQVILDSSKKIQNHDLKNLLLIENDKYFRSFDFYLKNYNRDLNTGFLIIDELGCIIEMNPSYTEVKNYSELRIMNKEQIIERLEKFYSDKIIFKKDNNEYVLEKIILRGMTFQDKISLDNFFYVKKLDKTLKNSSNLIMNKFVKKIRFQSNPDIHYYGYASLKNDKIVHNTHTTLVYLLAGLILIMFMLMIYIFNLNKTIMIKNYSNIYSMLILIIIHLTSFEIFSTKPLILISGFLIYFFIFFNIIFEKSK